MFEVADRQRWPTAPISFAGLGLRERQGYVENTDGAALDEFNKRNTLRDVVEQLINRDVPGVVAAL